MESVELIVYQIRGYNLIDFWLALLYCVGIGICISSLLYFHPNWIRLLHNVLQADAVSADLVLNRGSSEWWSFHDTDSLDGSGCGGLRGPMAIVVSEETPRK